ncbi:MAG: flippase-like domain-containing protein [Firmicutes bacterium]|nr:flippase-like domain-containing protein [Bacillota bacterium]
MIKQTFPLKKLLIKGLSLVIILAIASSIFLFASSISSGNFPKLNRLKYPALGVAILSLLLSWLAEGLRVKLIADGLGEPIPFVKLLGINLASSFTGNVTPFNSGGVPTQIFLLCRIGLAPGKAGALVTIRMVVTTLLFTIVSPFLILFYHARFSFGILRHVTTIAIPLAIILSIGLVIFIIKPKLVSNLLLKILNSLKLGRLGYKIGPYLERLTLEVEIFQRSIKEFRNWVNIILILLLTILYWFLFFGIAPLLMYAFGLNPAGKITEIILLQFILIFVLAYIPIPGGTGVMELSLYSLLVFIPLQFRAVFIFIWRFLSYYLSTFVGGVVLLKILNSRIQSAATPD